MAEPITDEVRYGDIVQHSRPTFVFTRLVSQRIGAMVAVVGVRRGWSPASVTLASLVLSLATSAVVVLQDAGLTVAIVATLGWQLAYALDCADGQLARATGRTSTAGGALDLYVDGIARLAMVAALLASVAARGYEVPTWAAAVLMGAALASLYHEAVNKLDAVDTAPSSRVRELLGAVRDPGLPYLVFGISLAFEPRWSIVALGYAAALGAAQYVVRFARLIPAARQV